MVAPDCMLADAMECQWGLFCVVIAILEEWA